MRQVPRYIPITGSHMAPTLRPSDVVVVVPIDGFDYDSLYAIESFGEPVIYRCQNVGTGIRISSDETLADGRPAYKGNTVTREWFSEHVLGIVVATCRVLDHARLGV